MANAKTLRLLLAALAVCLPAPASAQERIAASSVDAAYTCYLRIQGLQGDVTSPPAYAGWFKVDEYSISTTSAGTRANLSTLVVRGNFMAATPQIMVSTLNLAAIPSIQLDVLNATSAGPIQQLVLVRAFLVSTSGPNATQSGTQLEFSGEQLTWTWKQPTGDIVHVWDLAIGNAWFRTDPSRVAKPAPRATHVAFLGIPNVDGGATRPGYLRWFELHDFAFGANHQIVNGVVTPRADAPAVLATAAVSKGLVSLLDTFRRGASHSSMEIHVFRDPSATSPMLRVRLDSVVVNTIVHGANAAGGAFTLSLVPARAEWTGALGRGCWDFLRNSGC